jgi:hypothetical protein
LAMVLFNQKRGTMKITIESYGQKHTTEYENDDCTLDEYINSFFNLLIANGFNKESLLQGFKDYIQDIEQ